MNNKLIERIEITNKVLRRNNYELVKMTAIENNRWLKSLTNERTSQMFKVFSDMTYRLVDLRTKLFEFKINEEMPVVVMKFNWTQFKSYYGSLVPMMVVLFVFIWMILSIWRKKHLNEKRVGGD